MRQLVVLAIVCTALVGTLWSQAQSPAPQTQKPAQPQPSADPYANNPEAGAGKFPLAAPAGTDSGAETTPLEGGVNQGPFDPATWKYGPAFDPPPG